MGGRLDPAVARARAAVRAALSGVRVESPDRLLLVGVSGGADSLALAAATAFVAARDNWRWGAVTVDHALQNGSAGVASAAAEQAARLGADPALTVRVQVTAAGAQGPEAAARHARYQALSEHARKLGAAAVLVGHTRDDQAESALLGLARGSGARSLAGMAPMVEQHQTAGGGGPACLLLRPLLHLTRADTHAICVALGLTPWIDPHNSDRAYLRNRVRLDLLPLLERELGPGVGEALARTTDMLRDDADLLDTLAVDSFRRVRVRTADPQSGERKVVLHVAPLAAEHAAVRRRVLRLAALAAGAPATDLTHGHVQAIDRLITGWHGQRGLDLPGRVRARRVGDELQFTDGGVTP